MDSSYERVASGFMTARDPTIGVAEVRHWCNALSSGDALLDLGCGHGLPLGVLFRGRGLRLFAIDSSPTLLRKYRQHIPEAITCCESAVESDLFRQQFDGILACGLIFLLSRADQLTILQRITSRLRPGGRLLLTAPRQQGRWNDLLTGRECRSLGAVRYREVLRKHDVQVIREFADRGGNYYFDGVKAQGAPI